MNFVLDYITNNFVLTFGNVSDIVVAIVAIIGLRLTYKTGIFDKTPQVLASGNFILSTRTSSNSTRDSAINKKLANSFQLINVGRGLAQNIVPSKKIDKPGEFLEDFCPHSFNLPAGKSTDAFGEILRVHGQGIKEKFYIHFEDNEDKQYITTVEIARVKNADGEMGNLLNTPGIEIWKIIKNIPN